MNPREIKRMMSQMGIKQTEMSDVKEVIFKGTSKDYVIENATVTMIEAQGQKTFQVLGNMKEKQKTPEIREEFNEEDVSLVMEQCKVSKERAVEALKKANGEPAQAILDLQK